MNPPFFNRFDVVEAWYLYCVEYHNGMGSPEYKALSRISRISFSPRDSLSYETLTYNGKAIFDKLVEEGI